MQIIHSTNMPSPSERTLLNNDQLASRMGGDSEEAKQIIFLLRDCHKKKDPVLRLFNFSSITRLLPLPKHLTELHIAGCIKLKKLPTLPTNLVSLYVYRCTALEELANLPVNLENLALTQCDALESLPALPQLKSLKISRCNALTAPPNLPDTLSEYCIEDCSAFIS